MTKIIKLRGPIREFALAVGAYYRGGGLLTICSFRFVAYSRGAFSRGGGAIRGFTVISRAPQTPLYLYILLNNQEMNYNCKRDHL